MKCTKCKQQIKGKIAFLKAKALCPKCYSRIKYTKIEGRIKPLAWLDKANGYNL